MCDRNRTATRAGCELQPRDFFADPSVFFYDYRMDRTGSRAAGFPQGWRSIPERRLCKRTSEPLNRQRSGFPALPFRRLRITCTCSEPGPDDDRESIQSSHLHQ
jgi:hypothetical protein